MTLDPAPRWQIKVFYDGDCPLCAREIAFLKRRADRSGLAVFQDISAADFDATSTGVDHAALMARIHGALPDGTLVEGVEVFRRVYASVGLGWLAAPTRWPGLRQLAEFAYGIFARNRLRWTGRGNACANGTCTHATPGDSANA